MKSELNPEFHIHPVLPRLSLSPWWASRGSRSFAIAGRASCRRSSRPWPSRRGSRRSSRRWSRWWLGCTPPRPIRERKHWYRILNKGCHEKLCHTQQNKPVIMEHNAHVCTMLMILTSCFWHSSWMLLSLWKVLLFSWNKIWKTFKNAAKNVSVHWFPDKEPIRHSGKWCYKFKNFTFGWNAVITKFIVKEYIFGKKFKIHNSYIL